MKKVAIGLAVYLVLLAAIRVDAVKQRVPISISGQEYTGLAKNKLATTNFTTGASNQLVMAIDLAANTIDIEEWDAALSNQVDRQAASGTQALVFASYIMSKTFSANSNSVLFAADMQTGDPVDVDWNNDGTNDHQAAVSFFGKFNYKPTAILTNRDGLSYCTGVVTKVSATAQGVLNDSINGDGGVDRIMKSGRVRSGRTATFFDDPE